MSERKILGCFALIFFKDRKGSFSRLSEFSLLLFKVLWYKFFVHSEFDLVAQVSSFRVSFFWEILCQVCLLRARIKLSDNSYYLQCLDGHHHSCNVGNA